MLRNSDCRAVEWKVDVCNGKMKRWSNENKNNEYARVASIVDEKKKKKTIED